MTMMDPAVTQAANAAATAMSAALPTLPPAREIPSSLSASFKSWWASGEKEAAAAEERILRKLPYFIPPGVSPLTAANSAVIATSSRFNLSTPKHYLNTFSITPTTPSASAPPPAVFLHGYGAGHCFYFKNYPALGQWAGKRGASIYALDWLGMGRSARVPFTVRAARDDVDGRVGQAESFFVDALEQWRAHMGLETMTLVGHSLGGYLSVAYAERHPARVSRLVLLSPAGVPHDPHGTTLPAREVMESQDETRQGEGGAAEPATKGKVQRVKGEQEVQKKQESRSRKVFTYLWEEGWSPFQVVRSTLFWGPMLVSKYTTRRFSSLSEEETRDMHNYVQQITLAKGSGEYCISHILAPGAHARKPLVDRVAALRIPVTFVYGDHDWMDPQGGYEAVENMRKAGNGQGRMYIVPHAGHHVYLDNYKAVNELLVKELDRTLPQRKTT